MQTETKRTRGGLRRFVAQPDAYAERYGGFTLTPRDLDVLELVWRYRMVDSRHIKALVEEPGQRATRVIRRLQGLFHNRYVGRGVPRERLRAELNPKGSVHPIYWLETKGWRALVEAGRVDLDEEGEAAEEWRKAHGRITTWFAEHQVMISNFHCALELAVRKSPGLELASWDQSANVRGMVKLVDGTIHRLAPDAAFTIRENGTHRHFFLEADRSTEESRRIAAKYAAYWWFLQSPAYVKERPDHRRVAVLFVTTGEKRLGNLMEILGGEPKQGRTVFQAPNKPPYGGRGWFQFCLEQEYQLDKPETILAPIWRNVERPGELYPLV